MHLENLKEKFLTSGSLAGIMHGLCQSGAPDITEDLTFGHGNPGSRSFLRPPGHVGLF